MRWGVFTVVLLAVCVVQPGYLATMSLPVLGHIDLFLAIALTCGFLAPPREASIAGWIVGLAMDLCGSGALGAHAVGLGLAALAISRSREWLNGELWWVQILIGLVVGSAAALATGALNAVHERLWYAVSPSFSSRLTAGISDTIPAALLVVVIIGIQRALTSNRRGLRAYGRRA